MMFINGILNLITKILTHFGNTAAQVGCNCLMDEPEVPKELIEQMSKK